jgi:DNA repair exonuclease SbcCD ATPase subunit
LTGGDNTPLPKIKAMKVDKYLKSHIYFERLKSDIITVGNHTNFKGMFNEERIENLEKRISRIEQIQNAECNSAQMERRVQRALIDSNNEVVRRIFDDVSVSSVYGVDVFSPKTGDIQVRNAVFSGEVFKQAVSNGISDYLKKVEEDKTEAPTIASVLEKARRNAMAIQELLKRTECSNVNEVISKFELGVSFKKMYDEESRKRKELAQQRELLNRDLSNQIAKLSDKNQSLMQSEKSLICKLADKESELKRVEELSDGRYKEVAWLRGELKKQEQEVEKLKDENKHIKSVNAKRVVRTVDALCREEDAVVGYSDLKKRCEELERDKKYLDMANTALLQEDRKIREHLNERIKKLKQRLKKSSIRYRDLKESISHNGLKSV